MTDVTVQPAYLDELATQHEGAISEIGSALSGVDGTAKDLWFDHGVVCGAAIQEMEKTEGERARAGEAMQEVSAAIAENLCTASASYTATDEQASDVLDDQMLPG